MPWVCLQFVIVDFPDDTHYLRRMTGNNPKPDLVNINAHKSLVKFYQLVLKILSGNEILK